MDQYDIPIHNIESYIREKVVRRNISGGQKSIRGAAAGDLWISLYQTIRKNGLSFFHYLVDRFRDLNKTDQLSWIIDLRACPPQFFEYAHDSEHFDKILPEANFVRFKNRSKPVNLI